MQEWPCSIGNDEIQQELGVASWLEVEKEYAKSGPTWPARNQELVEARSMHTGILAGVIMLLIDTLNKSK